MRLSANYSFGWRGALRVALRGGERTGTFAAEVSMHSQEYLARHDGSATDDQPRGDHCAPRPDRT